MNAYSVAEWLAFNANDIRTELVGKYIKARGMDRRDAILYIHDVLYNHLCITYPEHDNDETMLAFQDELSCCSIRDGALFHRGRHVCFKCKVACLISLNGSPTLIRILSIPNTISAHNKTP